MCLQTALRFLVACSNENAEQVHRHSQLVRSCKHFRILPPRDRRMDQLGLLGGEKKRSPASLVDAIQTETSLHDSSRRMGVVWEHQVTGLVGNNLAKDQSFGVFLLHLAFFMSDHERLCRYA